MKQHEVHIIGGGLAGCEAAWQLAKRGVKVRLSEMRGAKTSDGSGMTAAHQGTGLAELVCSNSFRSDDADMNAVGLIHQEMRSLGSLIMEAAEVSKVPAGSALAVDRDIFSDAVYNILNRNSNIEIVRGNHRRFARKWRNYCRHRPANRDEFGAEHYCQNWARSPRLF